MRMIPILMAAAMLTGCASDPATKPAPVAAPAASTPATVVAPAPAPAPAAATADKAASGQFVAPAGYKVKKRGDATVYCKVETPVGTRFGTEYCYTQSDLERMEASRVNVRQEVERTRRTCTGAGCGGG
jgi:hypothetical protein